MELEKQFEEIHKLIKSAKEKAFRTINKELITLYWQVGEYVSKKVESQEWGSSVVLNLSNYIRKEEPSSRGFSSQNIWRMKQFYETYYDNQKLSLLVREISWSNNLLIISKTNNYIEKEFYIKLSIKESLKKKELERQLNSNLFDRVISSNEKRSPKLRETHPNADSFFRDNYMLDFLNLPKSYNERDFKKGILANLKQFVFNFNSSGSFYN